MPILARDHLAVKLRQNWLARTPAESNSIAGNLDDSLTSLNWLHNLNIMKIAVPTPPSSPIPKIEGAQDYNVKVNPNSILNIGVPLSQDTAPCMPMYDKIDYKTNPYVKPPYSYATLICMAMKETNKMKITLSDIYHWITENYMYYRMADPSWQNSIRHNLSLNKCFEKVPRRKDEPGKGGFWRINPEYSDMLVNGIYKKRRTSTRENIQPVKRIKKEVIEDDSNSSLTDFQRTLSNIKSESVDLLERVKNPADVGLNELKGDFCWNALLNQDIEVNGIRMKAEDILNSSESENVYNISPTSPISAMSPPHSEHNSDSGLEDIWDFNGDNHNDAPLDLTTSGSPLDLTVQGIGIKAPDGWLNDSLSYGLRHSGNRSGLSTPIAPSPSIDDTFSSHPWEESRLDFDEAIASFDMDTLFDISSIPLPSV
ncbi:forkhead box protein J1-A-like [Tubulanus polymorphus]|uniref:forkhead box protein J1-A-like n=1 Tax=Tubulanus polymorphus TaxID=672921 RepID=UPI003DA23FC4